MKAFLIIIIIIAAVIYGLRYSAEHSRKSAADYQRDVESTTRYYDNERKNVEGAFEIRRQQENQNK